MVRPQFLSRALDDLHAIANAARAAPKRADRIEAELKETRKAVAPLAKRMSAMQQELEAIDKRLRKLTKRLERNVDATRDVRRSVDRLDSGIDAVAASTQPIEPKLAMLHASMHRLANQLERDGGGET
jgi:predicted  nucleic acid-binding Zn-ribbon protein